MVDNLRLALRIARCGWMTTLEGYRRWLANRSSLMDAGERRLVEQNIASWNQTLSWLRQIDGIRRAA